MKNLTFLLLIAITFSSCSSDNELSIQNSNSLDFTEVMSFQVDTLDMDIISDVSTNSLFITSSNEDVWPEQFERVIKYNLSNSTQSEIIHDDDTESRQIEIVNNTIYSFSYISTIKYDLNLSNINDINYYNGLSYSKSTKYNNDIIILSGERCHDCTDMPLKLFDTNSETFNELSVFPNGIRMHADGSVLNDKLYMFGGTDLTTIYNELNIYDITNDIWSQETLPFGIYESFTSIYNDTIFVGGNKESDNSSAFIGIYDTTTNLYSELTTSLNLDNITIRGITILNDEIFVAYIDLVSPMPDLMTVKVVKASLL
ncbi:hypothetical protein HSX10_18135 [Winogradskyella undariae]|uniref:kelch repeat-containing protein n=1 Tax=Winogradskyella undariae TaxID=1285465 RepID=UPI00156B6DEE|nr:kelch repeat-containing protein [Winogradskyella undariae]NRR93496.1 hypothetical protein [Winogradskyella undariae]